MTTTPDNRVEVAHGDIVRHVRTGTTFRVITSPYQLGHQPGHRMVVESVRGPRRRKSVNPDDFARIDAEMGPVSGASLHSEQPADQGEHSEITPRRMTTMRLRELLDRWAPGSGTSRWTWIEEDRWLWAQQPAEMAALCDDIRANGIREPILLGGDGRVWDGHHRVCAAVFIGLDRVPIEHALGADPTHA